MNLITVAVVGFFIIFLLSEWLLFKAVQARYAPEAVAVDVAAPATLGFFGLVVGVFLMAKVGEVMPHSYYAVTISPFVLLGYAARRGDTPMRFGVDYVLRFIWLITAVIASSFSFLLPFPGPAFFSGILALGVAIFLGYDRRFRLEAVDPSQSTTPTKSEAPASSKN